jgi:hypothetical protein
MGSSTRHTLYRTNKYNQYKLLETKGNNRIGYNLPKHVTDCLHYTIMTGPLILGSLHCSILVESSTLLVPALETYFLNSSF